MCVLVLCTTNRTSQCFYYYNFHELTGILYNNFVVVVVFLFLSLFSLLTSTPFIFQMYMCVYDEHEVEIAKYNEEEKSSEQTLVFHIRELN